MIYTDLERELADLVPFKTEFHPRLRKMNDLYTWRTPARMDYLFHNVQAIITISETSVIGLSRARDFEEEDLPFLGCKRRSQLVSSDNANRLSCLD